MKDISKILEEIYNRLFRHFGPQGWWPAKTPFEVCVGAILTQNASWKNVEKAINNLKEKNLLDPFKLYELPLNILANIIKPSGFYNIKAKRLKEFIKFLVENYEGNLEKLFSKNLNEIRKELLNLRGLGKETVDSILLYAGNFPVFVVDTYTYRILNRHYLIPEESTYDEIQELFMENLPPDPKLFNEYHALFVACGKNYCKKKTPICEKCPLKDLK
ncbi:endonuclease III domain-containing protein [Thermodesulfobacterium hydrogeniphilum]|uniref:endonuclease III domain-containing protein n=1 Tax=Thermodesulfobacterium hydrogeniphilum TaxID=161156 RepID=UPI000571560A|nr:endonuclease III domain-containing protein [Thermodesulfobacterium hydrogeniphilum]